MDLFGQNILSRHLKSTFWTVQILACVLFIGCSTLHTIQRIPAAQDDTAYINSKNDYYLSLIPKKLRTETKIDLNKLEDLQKTCVQSEYGQWMRVMTNSEEAGRRKIFILNKLNRPFLFVTDADSDHKLNVLGRLEDFKELICVELTLQDGRINQQSALPPDLMEDILRLPNINFPAVHLILSSWPESSDVVEVGKAILSYPGLVIYDLEEIISALYRKKFTSEERLEILKALINLNLYNLKNFFQRNPDANKLS